MNRLGYYMKEGARSIFAHGLSSLATVLIIWACLLIMGSCVLLSLNVDHILGELEQQNPILAFVNESYSDSDSRALEARLGAVENVASLQFISRQEAMDSFLNRLQQSSLFQDVKPEVFRDRYVIYLNDTSMMAKTQQDLAGVPGIARVNAHLGISRGFATTRQVVDLVSAVLVVLLFVVCMIIMSSTLRVTAYERRNEVGVVKMIGATKGFIWSPLAVEGIFVGLTGSLLAFLLEWALYRLLEAKLMESSLSFLRVIPFQTLIIPLLLSFLLLGLLVAVLGSRLAIRSYIRM